MKVETLRQLIEQRLKQPGVTSLPIPDTPVLLDQISQVVWEIVEREDWTWRYKYLDPIIETSANDRTGLLPVDFGSNFLRGGHEGHGWTVKISDGNTDSDLSYERPDEFFSRDAVGTPTRRPEFYTIAPSGSGKYMYFDPTPDAVYTISGAYRPVWDGTPFEDTDTLPIPNHAAALYGVLKNIQPRQDWLLAFQGAMTALYNSEAQQTSRPTISIATSRRHGYTDEYDPQRNRHL